MKYSSGLGSPFGTHAQIVQAIPEGSTILSLGCAQGYLEEYLATEKHCKIYALEIEREAVERAQSYCVEAIEADLNTFTDTSSLPFAAMNFDVLLCGDILEHLLEPEQTLRLFAQKLRTNGILVLTLPNIAHFSVRFKLLFGMWNYTKTGIMDNTHTKFFTRKSAAAMVRNAGLTIQTTRGIGELNYLFGKVGLGSIGSMITNIFPGLLAIQNLYIASREDTSK